MNFQERSCIVLGKGNSEREVYFSAKSKMYIEKYLKTKLVDIPDPIFIKLIGDKYFTQRSLQSILLDYKNDPRTKIKGDNDGKNLYKVLTANLYKVGIDEDHFILYLCDDIFDYEDLNKFINTLNSLLY